MKEGAIERVREGDASMWWQQQQIREGVGMMMSKERMVLASACMLRCRVKRHGQGHYGLHFCIA